MAYNATYSDGDIGEVTIDAIVKVVIAFASLATLVGLALVYVWARKHWKG